jgi:hypothetical protein
MNTIIYTLIYVVCTCLILLGAIFTTTFLMDDTSSDSSSSSDDDMSNDQLDTRVAPIKVMPSPNPRPSPPASKTPPGSISRHAPIPSHREDRRAPSRSSQMMSPSQSRSNVAAYPPKLSPTHAIVKNYPGMPPDSSCLLKSSPPFSISPSKIPSSHSPRRSLSPAPQKSMSPSSSGQFYSGDRWYQEFHNEDMTGLSSIPAGNSAMCCPKKKRNKHRHKHDHHKKHRNSDHHPHWHREHHHGHHREHHGHHRDTNRAETRNIDPHHRKTFTTDPRTPLARPHVPLNV